MYKEASIKTKTELYYKEPLKRKIFQSPQTKNRVTLKILRKIEENFRKYTKKPSDTKYFVKLNLFEVLIKSELSTVPTNQIQLPLFNSSKIIHPPSKSTEKMINYSNKATDDVIKRIIILRNLYILLNAKKFFVCVCIIKLLCHFLPDLAQILNKAMNSKGAASKPVPGADFTQLLI